MPAGSRIVVFGGTGHFGARICRRLAATPGLDIVVTSRNAARAEALSAAIRDEGAAARVRATAIDQNAPDLADRIAGLEPAVVIHTAGPYQGQDYGVARACIDAGCHYVDLADGRQFVADFDTLDSPAKRAGLVLITGASTLPGVSSAVVAMLRERFLQIERVETSIAPAHRTPRGPGTVKAVLSYCGEPFDTWRDGAWRRVYGWQDLRWQRYTSLGRRLSAACDVPDLALFPGYVENLRTVSFHAALEAPWEQLALWCMAGLKRLHVVGDWARHAALFSALCERTTRFGSVRGGMRIRVAGRGLSGDPFRCDWELAAGSNHGPEIPCTPAIVIARKLLGGELTAPGARPCLGLFSVPEFVAELAGFDISAELREVG